MISTLATLVLAMLVTAALTPLVRRAALALGAVDDPTARRVHSRRIPRMGGIAIVIGFFVPLVVLFALSTDLARIFFGAPRIVGGLIVGSLLVAGLGLLDDIVGLGAKRKLVVQVIAACAAYVGGLRIEAVALPFMGEVQIGWLSLPATVLWITGVVNALNLIDGLDGLAAGIAFFACMTNFVVAFLTHNLLICLLSATLAGAILGFLIHNFNPATIFMGDSGSMFLGYMLATTSLMGAASQKSPTLIAILVPLLALGLPIMDMLFAMVRRFLERRPIFSPDRGHIHHRLLDIGLTHRRAVFVLYGVSLAFTVVALAVHLGRSWQIGMALLVLTLSIVGVIRFVGGLDATVLRQHRKTIDPVAEGLRRVVPRALSRIVSAPSLEDIYRLLSQLAEEAKLLAIEVTPTPGARLHPWRWEQSEASKTLLREGVSASFSVVDAHGVDAELRFLWDSAQGVASPQAEILLRLVADAVEDFLQHTERTRAAARANRVQVLS